MALARRQRPGPGLENSSEAVTDSALSDSPLLLCFHPLYTRSALVVRIFLPQSWARAPIR